MTDDIPTLEDMESSTRKDRLRFAIYREPDVALARVCVTLLEQEIKCELSGDNTVAELVKACLAELSEGATDTTEAKLLEEIEKAIRSSVELKGFKIEILPEADLQFEFHMDLQSGKTFGKMNALHPFASDRGELGRRIQTSIQNAFSQPAKELAASIHDALENDNQNEAARLALVEEPKLLLLAKSPALLDAVVAIDQERLPPSQANQLRKIIVSLASRQGREELVSDAAERLLQHDSTLDEQVRFGLKNMIAVGALKRGETETGIAMLRELLEEATQIDAAQRGWIWRNLSMALEPSTPEAQRSAQLSVDAFLEAGEKQEAARSIAQLSKLQEQKEPTAAIGQFDQMLDLMSVEGIFNDELRANILHAKARKLLNFGHPQSALKAAREAADLRREILGAEESRISSLHLAAIAATNCGDHATANSIDEEAKSIEVAIASAHFDHARRVAKLLEVWDADEANSLIKVASETKDHDLYACIHVAAAIGDPSHSHLQRLGRLESVLRELDVRKARQRTKNPVRLAIAQILKERGDFDSAAKWYRKVLDSSPLDVVTRQHYIDALWKAEKWGEAAIFLRAQLEVNGELPVMLYAYGRSLFEAGQLSESIGVFTRALKLTNENPALCNIIRELREKALELGGSIPPSPVQVASSKAVTLDDLRSAIKDFGTFVSASKRMDFWERRDAAEKHSWRSRPEKHGQTLLHTFLKATFKEQVDLFEEIGVGAGRLDLLVRLSGGVSAIIELKMCGSGYSAEYARSGEDQIEHYMTNRRVHVGLLVVFDARHRTNGSQLISRAEKAENTIEEITIDVRPTVKMDETLE